MITDQIITPLVSAAFGGGGVAFVVKLLATRWLKKSDDLVEAVNNLAKKMAAFDVHIDRFQKNEDRDSQHHTNIAKFEVKLDSMKHQIESLSHKVNQLELRP